MSHVYTPLVGRFGNQCFQYCFARAYAEQHGLTLCTPRWVGEQIFQIEPTPEKPAEALALNTYAQDQASLIYTRKQVREWFKWKPNVIGEAPVAMRPLLAHRRVGDYAGAGYVVVSKQSYWDCAKKYGHWFNEHCFVTEENPHQREICGIPWLSDFWRMCHCDVLLRGNSSFSWWAATLGHAKVYSPVIDGLEGGREHDCAFVEGNHSRLANLEFTTELRLREE